VSYLPAGVPSPEPTIDDQPFWDYCAAGELRFQRCPDCARFRHPPAPACPHCHSFRSEYVRAPDEAELFSFTIVHHAAHPAVAGTLPYNVAIVLFRPLDNVRLVSNIVDVAPADIRIGMRLHLVWEEAASGMKIPRFAAHAAKAGPA